MVEHGQPFPWVIVCVVAVVFLLVGILVGYILRKSKAEKTIGSSETQIGLVNDHQQIIAERSFPTDAEKAARGFIAKVAQEALDLLEEQHIPLDQCIGVGAGVPGTIDRRRGKVLYSNNLRWEDTNSLK